MAVYLPTAVVGNGRILVTLGPAAEVMGFFYPHIDFAQNVREGMPAIYVGPPGRGRLSWLFEAEWEREQSYVREAGIVVTRLRSERAGLCVRVTDFVLPEGALLVRRFDVANEGSQPLRATLFQYFWLTLGGLEHQQSLRHLPARDVMLQYFRDVTFVIGGGGGFDCFRCGRPIEEARSAKGDMGDGDLNGQPEDIGRVDLAVGWKMALAVGESESRTLLVSAGPSELEALRQYDDAAGQAYARLVDRVTEDSIGRDVCDAVLAGKRLVSGERDVEAECRRCLLTLRMLQNVETGAIIAAPEFDPGFEQSGGYGFCWPRDATFAALTLWEVGHREAAERFFDWCAATQAEDGLWRQRYWTDGTQAPGWCFAERLEQLDQSAAVAFAVAKCAAELGDAAEEAFMRRHGEMLRRALRAVLSRLAPDGLHAPAKGPWEAFSGRFTYTSAAIYGAVKRAAGLGHALGDERLRAECAEAATAVKGAVLSRFWNEAGYFVRGTRLDGQIDASVDSAVLGLLEPFELISLDADDERRMLEATVATIEEHLGASLDGGRGIFRFQFETYIGGAIGCVNTLWLAKVLLRLAQWYERRDEEESARLRARAEGYVRFCREHATPTGLLPELIGRNPETPYWAAPHAWATALYLQCLRLMSLPRECR